MVVQQKRGFLCFVEVEKGLGVSMRQQIELRQDLQAFRKTAFEVEVDTEIEKIDDD